MSLLDQLLSAGSSLSKYDGGAVPTNPLATRQSALHARATSPGSVRPGYSLDAALSSQVNKAFQQYDDGVTNFLPPPTTLDAANGFVPEGPLKDGSFPSINNTFKNGRYQDNLPEGALGG